MSPNAGVAGCQLYTWSPNKLWRFTSICNLWLSPRPNWDPPRPLPQASVSPPEPDTLARGWGVGGSHFWRLDTKPGTLSTLWLYLHCLMDFTNMWDILLAYCLLQKCTFINIFIFIYLLCASWYKFWNFRCIPPLEQNTFEFESFASHGKCLIYSTF